MVMKDKLTKTNHKAKYYRTRRVIFVFVAFVSAVTAISVPTYINIQNHNAVKAEKINLNEKMRGERTLESVLDEQPLKTRIK